MISLVNIEKTYQQFGIRTDALRGVNVTIQDGEMLAVMGVSGSGKTTLLNLIGCLDVPSCGQLTFCYGEEEFRIHEMKHRELNVFRKEHIGYVPQQFALIEDYTVFENVELPLIARGIPKRERKNA